MGDLSELVYDSLKVIFNIHQPADIDKRLCREGCNGRWPCSTYLEAQAALDAAGAKNTRINTIEKEIDDLELKALTNAIKYGMSKSESSYNYTYDVVRHADTWLRDNGYTISFVSRCWCDGMSNGNQHTPGCAGIDYEN